MELSKIGVVTFVVGRFLFEGDSYRLRIINEINFIRVHSPEIKKFNLKIYFDDSKEEFYKHINFIEIIQTFAEVINQLERTHQIYKQEYINTFLNIETPPASIELISEQPLKFATSCLKKHKVIK